MSKYPKCYLMTSTLGPDEFYFKYTENYLEERGINTVNIIPFSPDLKEYEAQVSKFLEDEKSEITLTGWSFAGNVAGEVGRKYPETVEKVVFTDSVLEWRYQPLGDRILMKFLTSLPKKYGSKILGNKLLLKNMLNKMIKRDIDEEIKERVLCSTYSLGGEWIYEAIKSGIEYTSIDSVKLIEDLLNNDIEVWMIYSSDETKDYIEKSGIREALQDSYFIEIKNCGHLLMFEAQKEFNEALYKIITS